MYLFGRNQELDIAGQQIMDTVLHAGRLYSRQRAWISAAEKQDQMHEHTQQLGMTLGPGPRTYTQVIQEDHAVQRKREKRAVAVVADPSAATRRWASCTASSSSPRITCTCSVASTSCAVALT